MLEKIGKIREYVTHRLYLYREAKRRKAWERAQEERSLALWG